MQFTYTARALDGQIKSGTEEAKDREELGHLLRARGYVLTSASSDDEKKKKDILGGLTNIFHRKISLVDKIMFTRNLAVMIGAGLALNKALETLKEQVESQKLKFIIGQVADNVQSGQPFSESLSHYPEAFSNLFVNMLRTGEPAVYLVTVLRKLADEMKKDYDVVS